jgi:hypothetical protein
MKVALAVTVLLFVACFSADGDDIARIPGEHDPVPVEDACETYVPPRVVLNRYMMRFRQAEIEFPPLSAMAVDGRIQEIIAHHSKTTDVCVESFGESLAKWCDPKGVNEKTYNGWKLVDGGYLYEGACQGGPQYLLVCPPAEEVPNAAAAERSRLEAVDSNGRGGRGRDNRLRLPVTEAP